MTCPSSEYGTHRCVRCDSEVEDADALRAENERLRRLIAEVEWSGSHWGITACPWCRENPGAERHAPKCPAFSARGEVRR